MITFDEALDIAYLYGVDEEVFFYMDELGLSPEHALAEAGIGISRVIKCKVIKHEEF